FSSRRRHTRFSRDWSSDVCSSDLLAASRNYDLEFFFTASDTTDRGNPLAFEIGQRDTTVNAGHWSKPFVSDRKPLSAKFSGNQRSEERRVGKECRYRWST